jgi:multiple sugar transport system substrate-binding protein
MKTNLTRRTLVKGGTALAASGALTGPALLEWAKAWAQQEAVSSHIRSEGA